MIFTAAVEPPNLDVRQVSSSMRAMITDSNTRRMLPAGTSSSVVVVGFGDQLARAVDMLRMIDDAAGGHAEAQELQVEVIALEHGQAQGIAPICGLVFNASGQVQRVQQVHPGAVAARSRLIVPDGRTHSLVVRGTAAGQRRVADLVAKLDVEVE